MFRSTARKVMWVGRATTFCVGLAVVLAVVFGLGATALAAVPGDPFKLGRINTIDRLTTLAGSVGGPLLKVDNNGNGPALALETKAGAPPLRVNVRSGKATNLNVDELDGKDSTDFYAWGEKVAASSHADRADTAVSADSAATASDANTLDGLDSTDFQAGNPCPDDSMFHEGVCIEKIGRGGSGTATFANAQSFCLNDERRLPTVAELQTFRNRQGHDFTGTEYTSQTWTDTDDTGQHQMVMLVGQAGTQSAVRAAEAGAAFRCVASPNPATPDTTTLDSIAVADLRDAVTAATSCGTDNNGSYANCGSIAQLAAYGYNQDADVILTITTATSTRWVAQSRHAAGIATYQYDTANGRLMCIANCP